MQKSAAKISQSPLFLVPLLCAGFALISPFSFAASAADLPSFDLKIKDHKFVPDHLEVPTGIKFQIKVMNEGPGSEEFESHDLSREKVVPVGKTVSINLGPLQAGEYRFFGDFHKDTAKGVLVATDASKGAPAAPAASQKAATPETPKKKK